jgi:hypothetical protein
MIRSLTILCGSVAALSLAIPQNAQAQAPFGVQLNVGPAGFSYQQGYPAPGAYAVPPPGAYAVPGPALAPVPVVPPPYVYARPYYPYYPYVRPAVVVPYRGYYYRRHR